MGMTLMLDSCVLLPLGERVRLELEDLRNFGDLSDLIDEDTLFVMWKGMMRSTEQEDKRRYINR